MVGRVGLAGRALAVALTLGAAATTVPGVAHAVEPGELRSAKAAARIAQHDGVVPPRSADARRSEYYVRVRDARGDGDRGFGDDASPAARRLADITRVTYKTPKARGGRLKIDIDWAVWRRGNALLQQAVTFVQAGDGDRAWLIVQNRNRVRVYDFSESEDPDGSEPEEIKPAQVSTAEAFGRNGKTGLTVSTEWLNARRVSMETIAFAGRDDRQSVDEVAGRVLRIGQRPS